MKLSRGDLVYVSDLSIDHAFRTSTPRIFLADVGGGWPVVCVSTGDEEKYPDGDYGIIHFRYALPVSASWYQIQDTVGLMKGIVKNNYTLIETTWTWEHYGGNNAFSITADRWAKCGEVIKSMSVEEADKKFEQDGYIKAFGSVWLQWMVKKGYDTSAWLLPGRKSGG